MEEMNKSKTNAKKPIEQRKVAPRVVVKSPAKKTSMDELYRDNPGKEFVYAPAGTSSGSFSAQGLVPVAGTDGRPMRVGSRVICEDVGDVRTQEIKAAHDEATDRINEIRDPTLQNSSDKTAKAKKPKS